MVIEYPRIGIKSKIYIMNDIDLKEHTVYTDHKHSIGTIF